MRHRELAIMVGVVAMAGPLTTGTALFAQGSRITITVLDQANRGVESVIFVRHEGKKIRFGETDDGGRFERVHQCQLGQTFQAEPQDRGAYFSSPERDCGPQVTLRVVGRKTPVGTALDISETVVPASGILGLRYVVVAKGVSKDTLKPSDDSGRRCELLVETNIVPELYAVDRNDKWLEVKHKADVKKSETKFIYNRPCAQVGANETKAKAAEAVATQTKIADFALDVDISAAMDDFSKGWPQ